MTAVPVPAAQQGARWAGWAEAVFVSAYRHRCESLRHISHSFSSLPKNPNLERQTQMPRHAWASQRTWTQNCA